MRIVVTGGAGDLGTRVVGRLRARGHQAVPVSRRSGVDLASGAGLEAALRGADAVVHCASSPWRPRAVDVEGTRRLVEALRGSDPPAHLVFISIVGCDANPLGYYRAKTAAEHILELSGGPSTVVRATQFHPLAAFMGRLLSAGPLVFSLGDMAVQPVDVDWVAARLAGLAEAPAPRGFRRTADLAGPDVIGLADVARQVAEHDGRRPPSRVVRMPPLGRPLRALSSGTNLPDGEVEVGGRRLEAWLAGMPVPLPRGRHGALG